MSSYRLVLTLALVVCLLLLATTLSNRSSSSGAPLATPAHRLVDEGGARPSRRRRRRRRVADRWTPISETDEAEAEAVNASQPAAALLASTPMPPAAAPGVDPTCHTADHRGYAGDGAAVWGMSFKLTSAAECCAACKVHAAVCGEPQNEGKPWWPSRPDLLCHKLRPKAPHVCQIWTYCPEEQCFAFDIHKHTRGECWLKYQDSDPTRPKDPHFGHTTYPEVMRSAPRKIWPWAVSEEIWPGPMPLYVPWVSGVLAPADAEVVSAPPNDKWRERWCKKHGPCDP